MEQLPRPTWTSANTMWKIRTIFLISEYSVEHNFTKQEVYLASSSSKNLFSYDPIGSGSLFHSLVSLDRRMHHFSFKYITISGFVTMLQFGYRKEKVDPTMMFTLSHLQKTM